MNKTQQQILTFLDDEKYVSGEDIAQKLGISRAAISKNIKALKENYQIIVSSNSRVGYRLQEKLDLIKVDELAKIFNNINYFYSIDSTSKYAIENQTKFSENAIFISEFQTDGFGRFKRKWISPFGKNIYCTMLEVVELDISKLNGLSIIVGISIARVLKNINLNAKLKWPNDIYVDDKKIAGVIINVSAEINGRAKIFIGFGINVNMQYNEEIFKDWTSIKLQSQRHANRTNLTIQIIKAIKEDLLVFIDKGFTHFKNDFESLNYLKNKEFSLLLSNKTYDNCSYVDLANNGEIIIKNSGGNYPFSSGDISILHKSINSK